MTNSKVDIRVDVLKRNWPTPTGQKAERYVGKIFSCTRVGNKISGKVEGNHGTYTVSIQLLDDSLDSACSCYIGKGGYCHHCGAFAATYLQTPEVFTVVEPKTVETINEAKSLAELQTYLTQITLDDLTKQLRAKGITQKAFAESIGMTPQHISAVKSSERHNRYFTELGAIKLACMWMLENIDE